MSTNIGAQWGTAATITCTLASLGSGSARQSNSVTITNGIATGIGFEDVAVQVEVKTGASAVSSTGYISVYIAASLDGGTTFTGGATGSDASYTTNGDEILLGSFVANANATKFYGGPFSIRAALGFIPQEFAIIVQNNSGAALDATEGNHLKQYQGIGTITS